MTSKSDKMRVVLIGPVLPFRGGIAQHTTMLHRFLSDVSDLLTISYVRQYPAWLFPGESDRDPSYVNHRESGVEYLIDSINPLTWCRAVERGLGFRADLVVIPWWTIFWVPCYSYIANKFRRSGVDVVFFCHNVIEHESAGWKAWLSKKTLSNGSRFVVHSKNDASNLRQLLPGSTVAIQAHPIYEQFPEPKGLLPRRRSFELLFYGFVRPYKGLDVLIEAMGLIKGKDIQLTIAGEFWDGENQTRMRISELGLDDHIEICARYHSEEETAELFARADIVVLPYRSATGSGVVPIAYHYNKPVIVSRVGGLPDVVSEGETGYIVPAGDSGALAKVLGELNSSTCKALQPNIITIKKTFSWEGLVEILLNAPVDYVYETS